MPDSPVTIKDDLSKDWDVQKEGYLIHRLKSQIADSQTIDAIQNGSIRPFGFSLAAQIIRFIRVKPFYFNIDLFSTPLLFLDPNLSLFLSLFLFFLLLQVLYAILLEFFFKFSVSLAEFFDSLIFARMIDPRFVFNVVYYRIFQFFLKIIYRFCFFLFIVFYKISNIDFYCWHLRHFYLAIFFCINIVRYGNLNKDIFSLSKNANIGLESIKWHFCFGVLIVKFNLFSIL